MKYPFTSSDVKNTITSHKDLIQQRQLHLTNINKSTDFVVESVNKIIDKVIDSKLELISTEELYKEKTGIRIKTVIDAGYKNLLDIHKASFKKLSDIKGISDSGALALKDYILSLRLDMKDDIKVKLSLDDKSKDNQNLILYLSKIISFNKLNETFTNDFDSYKESIEKNISILENGSGFFKKLFASKKTQEDTVNAYNKLYALLNESYGKNCLSYVKELCDIDNRSVKDALKHFSEDPIAFVNELEVIVPGISESNQSDYGLPKDLAEKIGAEAIYTEGLNCTLRRYQEWGVKYILHQDYVLLGDEMGLGKTIQAIAAMVSIKNCGATHFIVVCPASVLANWCREIKKFSDINVIKVHGKDRHECFKQWMDNGGVAVTTYETTEHLDIQEFTYNMIVVDEAHYIKNPEANRTKNVVKLSLYADRKLFMTGTALENRVEEMITLIQYLNPDVGEKIKDKTTFYSSSDFRKTVSTVYFRRKRDDVLTELPDLIQNEIWCTLNKDEEAKYEDAILNKNYSDARRLSWNIDDLSESCKADTLLEIVEEAKNDGRKIIVFSFFLDTINKISKLLGENGTEPITGSIPPQKRQEIIDDFNNAPAGKVLLAQIIAGGTGLNIQAASVVILCEPQFKPSIENQAISRAYRMGQTRSVLVYKLLCEDTIEEKIMDILRNKQAIFNEYADVSDVASETLAIDDKTMSHIVDEEIERIKAKRDSSV